MSQHFIPTVLLLVENGMTRHSSTSYFIRLKYLVMKYTGYIMAYRDKVLILQTAYKKYVLQYRRKHTLVN